MTTIGIDPGTNGGIAWITDGRACAEKMPDTLQDLWELVQDIQSNGQCHAFVEQVHSSPQMGVKSAFTFGQGFGQLEMALTAAGISFERVRPQVWQKSLGCMTKGDKNITSEGAGAIPGDQNHPRHRRLAAHRRIRQAVWSTLAS
jgi:hypothetical protein